MSKVFDYIIITVADQFQKDYLKNKLYKRNLQENTEYRIVIEKKKVGSGRSIIKYNKFCRKVSENAFICQKRKDMYTNF